MLLNFLIYLNSFVFVLIVIPLFMLSAFLWQHRKENGATQNFRWVIMTVTASKLFYFLMELAAAYYILDTHLVFSLRIILPILLGSLVLMTVNWWAFYKVKVLMRSVSSEINK